MFQKNQINKSSDHLSSLQHRWIHNGFYDQTAQVLLSTWVQARSTCTSHQHRELTGSRRQSLVVESLLYEAWDIHEVGLSKCWQSRWRDGRTQKVVCSVAIHQEAATNPLHQRQTLRLTVCDGPPTGNVFMCYCELDVRKEDEWLCTWYNALTSRCKEECRQSGWASSSAVR